MSQFLKLAISDGQRPTQRDRVAERVAGGVGRSHWRIPSTLNHVLPESI